MSTRTKTLTRAERHRQRQRGFTLLEVMIAMTILAGALTGLSIAIVRGVRASNHARLMTTATLLCRQQLVELEDGFIVDGFTDDSGIKEDKGEFEPIEYKRYHWTRTIEKIRLPSTDEMQSAATKLLQDKQQIGSSSSGSSSSSSSSASGSGANLSGQMGGFLGPVKDMLEQGIRRVTMRVIWDEPGLPNQSVEVVAFYTDMRRIPLPQ